MKASFDNKLSATNHMKAENVVVWKETQSREDRYAHSQGRVPDEHNGARAASDRCRISGADVHYVGADRAVPQCIERTTRVLSGCDI